MCFLTISVLQPNSSAICCNDQPSRRERMIAICAPVPAGPEAQLVNRPLLPREPPQTPPRVCCYVQTMLRIVFGSTAMCALGSPRARRAFVQHSPGNSPQPSTRIIECLTRWISLNLEKNVLYHVLRGLPVMKLMSHKLTQVSSIGGKIIVSPNPHRLAFRRVGVVDRRVAV